MEIIINATEVHRVYEEEAPANSWAAIKRQVAESPLTALGVAAGTGLLVYGLLKPKSHRRRNLIGKAAHAVAGRRMGSGANRTLKSLVGSLALGYLNRKINSKLRWR